MRPKATCIPADALLWALVGRIRDGGYLATESDLRALVGSGCPPERVREVLAREGAAHPERPFAHAIETLDRLGTALQ